MSMTVIPPTHDAAAEALQLSGEILRNLELSEIPLANAAMKAARLARLLNEFDYQRIMEYEVGGYPAEPTGVPPEVWRLAGLAGRHYRQKEGENAEKEYTYLQSIGALEEEIRLDEISLQAAVDRNVSISSANPTQYVSAPLGNANERVRLRKAMREAAARLASRRAFIYTYVLQKHYELKYSGVAEDIFSRVRNKVDARIGQLVPDAVQRFSAVYDSLLSTNPEDWSNAVHSCRRILQDLADAVFPATDEVVTKSVGGKETTIRLGQEHYINRIIAFVEGESTSTRFKAIVGSQLSFLGDRLDSVFKAAQKGSHKTIVSREEADRYTLYTYLIVGDILTLTDSDEGSRSAYGSKQTVSGDSVEASLPLEATDGQPAAEPAARR
jgi:hypothetical protein